MRKDVTTARLTNVVGSDTLPLSKEVYISIYLQKGYCTDGDADYSGTARQVSERVCLNQRELELQRAHSFSLLRNSGAFLEMLSNTLAVFADQTLVLFRELKG